MQFSINIHWLHLSCVGGKQKVMSLHAIHHVCVCVCVCVDYVGDIIMQRM
jgi:hypothetical protein